MGIKDFWDIKKGRRSRKRNNNLERIRERRLFREKIRGERIFGKLKRGEEVEKRKNTLEKEYENGDFQGEN